MNFHFAPEEHENITSTLHRIIFYGCLYRFRRNIRWDKHILDVLTRMLIVDAKSLQYDGGFQESRYAIRDRRFLLYMTQKNTKTKYLGTQEQSEKP